jgi:hypothetical protein
MTWPAPEPGLVIRYAYLWRRQQQAGQDEGTKDRPCAVVLAVTDNRTRKPRVIVLPITHVAPQEPTVGLELPGPTKRRLGLDGERSWIIVSEANDFFWPRPDLRLLPGRGPDSAAYGILPKALFRIVRDSFLAELRARRSKVVTKND